VKTKLHMIRSAFQETLDLHGVELTRDVTTTLQINVGLAATLPAATAIWRRPGPEGDDERGDRGSGDCLRRTYPLRDN